MSAPSTIGFWQARLFRRLTRRDVVALLALVALAALVIASGRRARAALKPRSAVTASRLLDDLELPARLPNAPVTNASGEAAPLFDRMKHDRAAVAFYAPWCGPCQRELPMLSSYLGKHVDIFVVVSADEDIAETRRKLENLGLAQLGFLIDTTGQLQREGRVSALPTTFIVTRQGAVLARTRGYSMMELMQLGRKFGGKEDLSPFGGAEEEE